MKGERAKKNEQEGIQTNGLIAFLAAD